MNPLAAALLAAALHLPGAGADATDRAGWLSRVALATGDAAHRATCSGPWAAADETVCEPIWPDKDPVPLAALILAEGYEESRLLERIQAGRCGPDECDAAKARNGQVFHLARSLWQIQASGPVTRADWWGLVGTDDRALGDAAWTAARVLTSSRGRCAPAKGRYLEPTIAAYATGYACGWAPARKRAWLVERVEGWVRAAMVGASSLRAG